MKANELKRGVVVSLGGRSYVVREVQVKTPSSRSGNTLYKITFRDVVSRQKLDETFKGEDILQEVTFARRPVQLLFRDGDGVTFMDRESYEQYVIDAAAIADELPYLIDGLEGVHALIADGAILGIELPPAVDMEIVDCPPAIKGASATARGKPATLSTGLVVQVPEYISLGEFIKVNTVTGEFISRA